jgi:hypothetical protein
MEMIEGSPYIYGNGWSFISYQFIEIAGAWKQNTCQHERYLRRQTALEFVRFKILPTLRLVAEFHPVIVAIRRTLLTSGTEVHCQHGVNLPIVMTLQVPAQ